MPRIALKLVWWLAWGALVPALSGTVLEQLTLADMSQKSTSIVRARVKATGALLKNSDVYTVYTLDVLDTWKGSRRIDSVAVPGGIAGGIRQIVAGAPELKPGGEYVLFLWTGRSGLTQVIGLSQGIYRVAVDSGMTQDPTVTRAPIQERMVSAQGKEVQSPAESMKLSALRRQVEASLRGARDTQQDVAQGGAW